MKKFLLLLASLLFLGTFMSCDNGSAAGDSTDPAADTTTTTPTALTSTWFIKGSFDGWADSIDAGTRHYFTMDELDNNILTFEITGLYAIGYEFVIVDGDGIEWKAATATPAVSETANVFVNAAYTNATFTATKSSYFVTIDVTNTTAPSVIITAGATDALAPTAAILGENLKLQGDAFDIGWNPTAGTTVDNGNGTATVTFSALAAAKKTGGKFGFGSLDGYLKGTATTSPTTVSSSIAAYVYPDHADGDLLLNDIPMSDSVFDIVITIDEDAVIGEKYSMVVSLTTVGTTDWAFDPWTEVFIPGKTIDNFATVGTTTIVADVATYHFTAAYATTEFKISPMSGWDGAIGFGGIIEGAGSLTLSDTGNIGVTTTISAAYTMVIDMSKANYAVDGKPTVTVTAD